MKTLFAEFHYCSQHIQVTVFYRTEIGVIKKTHHRYAHVGRMRKGWPGHSKMQEMQS